MAAEELLQYTNGQIQQGADLQSAVGADFTIENNAKLQHTLRRNAAGIIIGVVDVSGSIDIVVDETGLEKEWLQMVLGGRAVKLRYKLPLLTGNFDGFAKTAAVTLKTGEAVTVKISVVGKIAFS